MSHGATRWSVVLMCAIGMRGTNAEASPASLLIHEAAPNADVAAAAPEPSVAPVIVPSSRGWGFHEHEPVQYASWRGTSFGAFMAPAELHPDETGGYDVAFHFHAAMMAERDWKDSGLDTVVASATFGIGSSYYADAFASPQRFAQMLAEINSFLEGREKRALHVRHVTLVAWSAGFAAVSRILSVPAYYDKVDSVVLLDGLHAPYVGTAPESGGASEQGVDKVAVSALSNFVHFARDAIAGKKTFVITHSSIVPPDYASSTEATSALLREVGVERGPAIELSLRQAELKMTMTSAADSGDLHVRGFTGRSQSAHIDHLHLVGDVLKTYVVPRRDAAP
jgi:hypothetical protein